MTHTQAMWFLKVTSKVIAISFKNWYSNSVDCTPEGKMYGNAKSSEKSQLKNVDKNIATKSLKISQTYSEVAILSTLLPR